MTELKSGLNDWLPERLAGWLSHWLIIGQSWVSGWVTLQLNPFTSSGLWAKTGLSLGTENLNISLLNNRFNLLRCVHVCVCFGIGKADCQTLNMLADASTFPTQRFSWQFLIYLTFFFNQATVIKCHWQKTNLKARLKNAMTSRIKCEVESVWVDKWMQLFLNYNGVKAFLCVCVCLLLCVWKQFPCSQHSMCGMCGWWCLLQVTLRLSG